MEENKQAEKTPEDILIEFGCPPIPYDEYVKMYYPAILSAMEEYAKVYHQSQLREIKANLENKIIASELLDFTKGFNAGLTKSLEIIDTYIK